MHTPSSLRMYLQTHRLARLLVGSMGTLLTLAVLCLGSGFVTPHRAFAQSRCADGAQSYVVAAGDTLSAIADRFNTNWQNLAASNHLADANLIYVDETICISVNASASNSTLNAGTNDAATGPGGAYNPYPYGQCTWWADERYHQLHGIYVPWTNVSSDAWQWTQRAQAYGWHVSNQPSVGAIVNFQPWVQGAYGLGHVAVVEQVLDNGDFVASNMNWGSNPGAITNVTFSSGSGVTFLTA